ncbi:MAG: hypothetical protein Q3990_09500, partial [Desulfovibrionaceae bacterium]|nr:hypothetical protein [Desulfovibrionaceae bacterium]
MFSIFDNIAFGGTYSPAAVGQEFAFLNAVGEYKPETRYNPYCDGLRCYDRDDYFPVGYSE